jgi:hypothetical protein
MNKLIIAILLMILSFTSYAADKTQPFDACRFYLKHTKEPSLQKQGDGKIEAYRFTMYSYWGGGHYVRITRKSESYFLNIGKMISSGKIPKWIETEKTISLKEWNNLRSLINNASFESLSSTDEVFGFDGSDIILEGVKEGAYHYVKRWAPENETKKRDLEEFMRAYSVFKKYIEEMK